MIYVSVDTSELESRLAGIDERINDLGGEDILDEDAVTRIVEGFDYITRDDVSNGYVSSDDLSTLVEDVLTSNDYVTSYDVETKIDDKLESIGDFATEADLAALDGRIDRVSQRLEDRLNNLQGTLHSQVTRIEALEAKLEASDMGQALTFFGLLRQAFNALRI